MSRRKWEAPPSECLRREVRNRGLLLSAYSVSPDAVSHEIKQESRQVSVTSWPDAMQRLLKCNSVIWSIPNCGASDTDASLAYKQISRPYGIPFAVLGPHVHCWKRIRVNAVPTNVYVPEIGHTAFPRLLSLIEHLAQLNLVPVVQRAEGPSIRQVREPFIASARGC